MLETNHGDWQDEDRLAADIREAFGLGTRSADIGVPACGPASPGSSAGQGGGSLDQWSLVGQRLDDFEVLGELGRGGMGVVYRARQLSLSREVALKVLPDSAHRGHSAVHRFRTEAQAAARLHHTNIVPIYAQGEAGGHLYYVMELIEGGSLYTAIKSRSRILCPSNASLANHSATTTRLPDRPDGENAPADAPPPPATPAPADARMLHRTADDYRYLARLIAEVADALGHAHRCGVIHRDLKPQNLLVGRDGRLQITDFGLARLLDEPGVTLTGDVMGTPAYLSPEQIHADHGTIDHRTDIYSLGVTIYELLTLRRPFEGETREQILHGIDVLEPVALRRLDPSIPRDLETICLKAMQKQPAERYPSAEALGEDLRRFADGRPILSRPPGPVGRAVKWARRHKAASTAMVCGAIAVLSATGLGLSVAATRHGRADLLVHQAYDRLIFLDYHQYEQARADLAEAVRLQGPSPQTQFLLGVAALGEFGESAAIDELSAALQADPTSTETMYALAWAYDRNHQQQQADELIAEAGPPRPQSAGAWFLRGLALHYDQPDKAIASYVQARTVRALDRQPFLQATLHLARAYNQRMYSRRQIDDFARAADALNQLIDYGVYDDYPYYLLSVAHRLAAEIYAGSAGTRDDSQVQYHYSEALRLAREGQARSRPGRARPLAAEAECLESMENLDDAIAARSLAIERASDDYTKCEGYHYRWRLNFWTGRLDDALADVVNHRSCPLDTKLFYDHVYPALIYAEMGRMQDALAAAQGIADADPANPLAVVWAANLLRLFGRPEAADRLLNERIAALDFAAGLTAPRTSTWTEHLVEFVRGRQDLATLVDLAATTEQNWKLWGEAYFHSGVIKLAAGQRQAALADLERAVRSFDNEEGYTYHARLLTEKLRRDPAWPPWINEQTIESDTPAAVQQ